MKASMENKREFKTKKLGSQPFCQGASPRGGRRSVRFFFAFLRRLSLFNEHSSLFRVCGGREECAGS